MIESGQVIIWSWAVFFLDWLISSFMVKRDEPSRLDRSREPFLRLLLILFILIFIWSSFSQGAGFDQGLFFTSDWVGWIGAMCTVAGVLLAIWARYYLGRNWSSHPTRKADHELIVQGPYTYVRHPIYTGLVLATFGGALTGNVFAVGFFIFMAAIVASRIPKEERIMLELFPDAYPAYCARSKKLIPLVW